MTGISKNYIANAGYHIGSSHVEKGIPCQDRAHAWTTPRPALIIIDGRGSATHSHLGAAASLDLLQKIITEREADLAIILDGPPSKLHQIGWKSLAFHLYHQAALEQIKLADFFNLAPADFEFTLTLAIIGKERLGWLAVGDSPLLIQKNQIAALITKPDQPEFANQTHFVTTEPRASLGIQGGLIDTHGLEGLAAMSDGAAFRFIDLQNHLPAKAISQLHQHNQNPDLNPIPDLLAHDSWKSRIGDDLSLALLTCRPPSPSSPTKKAKHRKPKNKTKRLITS